MPLVRRFGLLAVRILTLSLCGTASSIQAASHYVPDPAFPSVGLTGPIGSPMNLLPLQDGGALVLSSSSGFSFGDGQSTTPLLRLGPTGSVVNRQFAGSSASSIAGASQPAWAQLGNGKVVAALTVVAGAISTSSLVQIGLDGTVDPSLTLTVTAPSGILSASIAGLWRLADGSVIVAGQFSAVGGHATRNLAHLTAAGAIDPSYTCQVPLSGPYDVASDGTVVGVNPAPSNTGTNSSSLTRVDATANVTDFWNLPVGTGPASVALEASGDVLLVTNSNFGIVAIPVVIPLLVLPVTQTNSTLYRFKRGVATPAALYTGAASPVTVTGLRVLQDGTILLIGGPAALYTTQTIGLIHLSATGVLDSSFSIGALGSEVVEQVVRGPNCWFVESTIPSPAAQRWREFTLDFGNQLVFDPDLRAAPNVSDAVPLPDSSVLWQGSFETPSRGMQSFVRSRPDGTLDYVHVPLTPEAASARIAAVGADGSIYLMAALTTTLTGTGTIETSLPVTAAAVSAALGPAELERYHSDGSWDSGFGRPALQRPNALLNSVSIDSLGRLILCANSGGSGSFPRPAERLLPSGVLDESFAAIGYFVEPGPVLSGGELSDLAGYLLLDALGNLLRFDLNGKPFGSNYQVSGAQQLIQSGGDLFIAGSFTTVLDSPSPVLQRLGSDGLPDPSWHSGLSPSVAISRVEALPEGRVLAVSFTSAVLTTEGGVDLNDPIAALARPVVTADGALVTLTRDGILHRSVLQTLPQVSLQTSVPGGGVSPRTGDPLILTVSSSAQTSGAVVWRHNGLVVSGVSGNQLSVASLTSADSGWYSAGVPTAEGVVYTTTWVQVTPYLARIANASARVYFADTQQSLTTGSVIQGSSAEAALLRVLGPSLATFGVPDSAQGFTVRYFLNGNPIIGLPLPGFGFPLYTGLEPMINTELLAGAFPILAFNNEVQLQLTLNAGNVYSTSTVAVQPGTALFELYLPEPAAATTKRKLINFSGRSTVGSGERVLVLGFTIEGTQSLSVLVRGIGPALQSFGVSAHLSAPLLQLYSGQGVLLNSNDHWQNQTNAAQIATAATAVHAFPLAAGSADTALLTTLPPGTYTAVLSATETPNQGMIELYEVGQPN